MSYQEKQPPVNEAIAMVIDEIKQGLYSSVAQAIDRVSAITGMDRSQISQDIIDRFREEFNSD